MMNTAVRSPLIASALVYVAFTLLMGGELLGRLGTAIANDLGDPVLNAAILGWNARHLPGTDAWFNFPSYYPATDVLTFSEHLLGVSILATPLHWLTGSTLAAYNITFLLSYVLCGLAMFALVWYLTANGPASFLAGLAYAFAPYKVSQVGHIQVGVAFWAPLALLGLHRFLDVRLKDDTTTVRPTAERRWGALALFAVCWMLQGAANGYFLVFFSIVVGLWVLWFVVARRRWREMALIAGAAAIAAVPLLLILMRFVAAHRRYQLTRTPDQIMEFSADISSIACNPPMLRFWTRIWPAECRSEGELFLGIALPALCLVAVALLARRHSMSWPSRVAAILSGLLFIAGTAQTGAAVAVAIGGPWSARIAGIRISASSVPEPFVQGVVLLLLAAALSPSVWRAARHGSIPAFYLFAAVLTWAFTWGPAPRLYGVAVLGDGPYAWLMQLPGLDGLRVPARFWMMTVLCVCVAMGVLLGRALTRRNAVVAALVTVLGACGLAADGFMNLPAVTMLPPPPRADLLSGKVTLTLPVRVGIERDLRALFDAVEGGWVTANGYSGYDAPHYRFLHYASQQADATVLLPFVARGDLHVVVYDDAPPLVALVERQRGARLVGAANGMRQYVIPGQGTPARTDAAGEPIDIVSVSTSCSPEKSALVLDRDSESRWECGPQHAGQTLTADLGRVVTVGDVVPALGPHLADFPRHLIVETSADGTTWEAGWEGAVLTEAFEAVARDPRTRIVLPLPPRQARYVRLRLTSNDPVWYWSVAELEVWSGTP